MLSLKMFLVKQQSPLFLTQPQSGHLSPSNLFLLSDICLSLRQCCYTALFHITFHISHFTYRLTGCYMGKGLRSPTSPSFSLSSSHKYIAILAARVTFRNALAPLLIHPGQSPGAPYHVSSAEAAGASAFPSSPPSFSLQVPVIHLYSQPSVSRDLQPWSQPTVDRSIRGESTASVWHTYSLLSRATSP